MRKLLALVLIAVVLLTAVVAWAGAAPGILVAVGALLPPEPIGTAAAEPGRIARSIDSTSAALLRGPPVLPSSPGKTRNPAKEEAWREGIGSQRYSPT